MLVIGMSFMGSFETGLMALMVFPWMGTPIGILLRTRGLFSSDTAAVLFIGDSSTFLRSSLACKLKGNKI